MILRTLSAPASGQRAISSRWFGITTSDELSSAFIVYAQNAPPRATVSAPSVSRDSKLPRVRFQRLML